MSGDDNIMTAQDWTLIISSLLTALVVGFNAVTQWLDKRRKAEWEREDIEYKRRMEDTAAAAAVEARKAVAVAVQSKAEIKKVLTESRAERSAQVDDLKALNTAALAAGEAAYKTANNTNEKMFSLGLQFRKPDPETPPAS